MTFIFGICICVPVRISFAEGIETAQSRYEASPAKNEIFSQANHTQPEKSGLYLDIYGLLEYRAERGLKNLEPHSIVLTNLGLKAANEKKKNKAIWLFEKAKELSPDLPLPYLYLTRANFSFSKKGFSTASNYFLNARKAFLNNFWWSFQTLGVLSVSLLLAIYISVIVLLLTLVFSKFRLYIHDIKEDKRKIFLMFPPVGLAFFGPIFGVIGLMLPFWLYIKGKEKAVVYTAVVVVAVIVFIMPLFSSFLGALQDETLRHVVKMNNGIYTGEATEMAEGSRGYEEAFTYALNLKKKGHYREAIKIYQELLDQKDNAKVYNNLANSYIGLGNYDMALKYYDRALQLSKMASTYYNLSQVNREVFNFNDAKTYYQSAIEVDSEKVAFYNSVKGTSVNRFVMDETLSNKELWLLAFSWSPYYKSSMYLGRMFSFITREFSIVLFLLLILIFYIYGKYISSGAYACRRCGEIYCNKCEKKISQENICHTCFKTLVKISELPSQERVERILEIHHYKDRRNKRLKILTLIFPGSGHVYYGWSVRGFMILILFTFFLFLTLLWFYIPVPVSMNQITGFFRWVSIAGLILVYVFTAINIFRRIP
jgi:tetratricopeptide (TPR) repeat protein